jgi:hypothetical protein
MQCQEAMRGDDYAAGFPSIQQGFRLRHGEMRAFLVVAVVRFCSATGLTMLDRVFIRGACARAFYHIRKNARQSGRIFYRKDA